MKINWKVRFQNKVWVTSLVTFLITTVYNSLQIFDVMPKVEAGTVMTVAMSILNLLTLLGILIDPTSKGVCDSEQMISCQNPNKCD